MSCIKFASNSGTLVWVHWQADQFASTLLFLTVFNRWQFFSHCMFKCFLPCVDVGMHIHFLVDLLTLYLLLKPPLLLIHSGHNVVPLVEGKTKQAKPEVTFHYCWNSLHAVFWHPPGLNLAAVILKWWRLLCLWSHYQGHGQLMLNWALVKTSKHLHSSEESVCWNDVLCLMLVFMLMNHFRCLKRFDCLMLFALKVLLISIFEKPTF